MTTAPLALSRRKAALFAFLSVVISIVGFLAAAEIVLRFLPVGSGLRSVDVTAEQPVFHFTPNGSFTFSAGWDMHEVNHGHINNAGFVNDQDYVKDDPRPVIAVVGDSFIEAQMVPYAETAQARLAAALKDKFRVYSFAAAGAPLSQYMIWAQYAVREFGAKAVIINVVGNDFDESHVAYKQAPGFWYYAPDQNDRLKLVMYPLHRGTLWNMLQKSALARYLFINLELGQYPFAIDIIRRLFFVTPAQAAPDRYAGNTATDTNPKRVQDSYDVIDAVFRDLPSVIGLPADHIAFTLDGFRYPELAARNHNSYFDLMRRTFLSQAQHFGYEAIDLDPLFFARHQASGERFEFPLDGHWSGKGHAVMADAVLSSRLLAHLRQQ
jgi:hypothetical protein